jgi:hypothetical protein
MPVKSPRRRGVVTLQVLLAMVFLAIIGGSAGYLAGQRRLHRTAAAQHSAPTVTRPGKANKSPNRPASPETPRCLRHTEEQAGESPLFQLLYVQTQQGSEVWICKGQGGKLYYQGHAGQPGETLTEGTNALFANHVEREGSDGYVATYTDGQDQVTEYHVNPRELVIKFRGYASPRADRTEQAVPQ